MLRPVITGINWYTSFDTPSPVGLVEITPELTVRGGHEVVADQIDAEHKLVWFWNSWGLAFGVAGRFCMSFATWGDGCSRARRCHCADCLSAQRAHGR